MQIALLYGDDAPVANLWALETIPQGEEDMADDDDEAFDDEMQDEEDLYQLRTNDDDGDLAPGDEDHLPDEELQ